MADTKISALTEVTSLTTDDLIPVVDDPSGSPITKKITSANLALSLLPSQSGKTGKYLKTDGSAVSWEAISGTGETNTASNVGTAGVGVYKQKTSVDLEFKKINAGSNKVTITDDVANSEVDIDIAEANVVHQNLSGAGTNTHAQIDSHIASTSNPHSVTKTQLTLGNVENTAISTWAGTSNVVTVGTLSSGDATGVVSAATTSLAGKSELATTAETTTGTDTGRTVTPDGLSGSIYGRKTVVIKVISDDTALTTGDGKVYFTIPEDFTGMNLVSAQAHVYTVSSSGTPNVMIHNNTDNTDMLSTAITIDANEKDSSTAATPSVVNTSYDDVVTSDEIRIDVDTAGTGTKGLELRLVFQTP